MRILIYLVFLCIAKLVMPNSDQRLTQRTAAIRDMTFLCNDGEPIRRFLPYGMGSADADVSFISSTNKDPPNCIFHFESPGDLFVCFLIVVEIMKKNSDSEISDVCLENSHPITMMTPSATKDVCSEMKNNYASGTDIFRVVVREDRRASVNISMKTFKETLKITATSAKVVNSEDDCDEKLETPCIVGPNSLCMSKELDCDKNINCGIPKSYDEDYRICEGTGNTYMWVTVLASVVMIIILLYFFLNLLYMCLPHVPDNFFIFNEDEDNRLILMSQLRPPIESDTRPRKIETEFSPASHGLDSVSSKYSRAYRSTHSVDSRYVHLVPRRDVINPNTSEIKLCKITLSGDGKTISVSELVDVHRSNISSAKKENMGQKASKSLSYVERRSMGNQFDETMEKHETELGAEEYSLSTLRKKSIPANPSESYEIIIHELDKL